MKISVSFTKGIYDYKTTVQKIDTTSADYIHVDLMDGKFVSVKQQLPSELNKVLKNIKKPLDVHIMAFNPLKYLEYFANLNTEYFIFHHESVKDVKKTISEIESTGLKVGLAINPKTKIENILSYLSDLDQILVMSVEPGLGGQEFIDTVLYKITTLKKLKEERNYRYIISVDGGINEKTSIKVKEAGVDMMVSGSYICQDDDFESRINILK